MVAPCHEGLAERYSQWRKEEQEMGETIMDSPGVAEELREYRIRRVVCSTFAGAALLLAASNAYFCGESVGKANYWWVGASGVAALISTAAVPLFIRDAKKEHRKVKELEGKTQS